MKKLNTREVVMIGLLIALQIIFTRMFSIQTPTVRIGFSFLPLAMCSMLYGPLAGGVAAAIADVIGITLFPIAPFFPGFTLSAFLSGVVYGMLLHRKPKNIFNTTSAVLIVCLIIDLCLGTLWLSIIMKKGVLAILPARIFKTAIMIPIQVPLIMVLWRYVGNRYENMFFNSN